MDVSALQVQKGVTLQKDLEKVMVDYNNANSELRIAESNLSLAQNQLKYEMGYPFKQEILVDSLSGREFPGEQLS